jgi:hypothetical protein
VGRVGLWAAIFLWALSACAELPSADAPREYLDKDTAATVNVVGRALVFAHERPERAAHMRDYVTLAGAAIDRNGKVNYVLIAYFWTTFDAHGLEGESFKQRTLGVAAKPIVIVADDRRILLKPQEANAYDAGIGSAVDAPPGHEVRPWVFGTDLPTLRFISAARRLAVQTDPEDPSALFQLWADRRDSLKSLVRVLSGE